MAGTGQARLTVAEVMTTSVVSVTPSTSLRDVARLLVEHHLSAVPVVGADGAPVGLVSEADLVLDQPAILRGEAHHPASALDRPAVAGQMMSTPVAAIPPAASLSEAARAMAGLAVRRLLVVDESGALVGIVSRADLLRALLRPDAEVRRALLAEMTEAGLLEGGSTVSVSVADGAVTLSGRVPSRGHAAALMTLAAGVDGVAGVTSELEYGPEPGKARPAAAVPPLGGPHRCVAEVMTRDLVRARPSTSIRELARLMGERGVSALPVVDDDGRPLGVVSEADLLVKERELAERHSGLWVESRPTARERAKAEALDAGSLMTSPVITVPGDVTLAAAARRLDDEGVKRLFVVDEGGRLLGVVSRRDLLRAFEVDDAEIRRRVLRAVAPRGLWTDLAHIDVTVRDGVVTLRGDLPYRSDAVALVGLAEAVEGIVAVRDELTSAVDDVGDLRSL